MFFPCPPRLQGEQPRARPAGFSRNTNHETRNTAFFETRLFIVLFWRKIMSQLSSIDRLPSEARKALHGRLRYPAITQTEAAQQPAEKRVQRVSRQVRRLQGGMYEAVRKRVERGLSESREKNNDFFRIPTRFTTRNIPLFPTMRRKDSDKPLPPIKRLRALRQPGYRLHGCFASPRNLRCPAGFAKWRVAAFLGAVERHGAAMARHGRHIAPEPLFPLPSAVPVALRPRSAVANAT